MEKVNRIVDVLELNLKNKDGARKLKVSLAQYKRYKAAYKKYGALSLLHGGFGNSNARKYSVEVRQHIVATYNAESLVISETSNMQRGPRKIKVFASLYSEKYNVHLPYTTCKKILNDANIESPICRFEEEYAKNIPLPNPKNIQKAGFEFQGDGSTSYKFPDDDFEVVAHVVVEASSSQLCGLNFQKGECNIGYYYAYRDAFVNVGVPHQNCTDGRTTFFNVNDSNAQTVMGKILSKLGINQITTRNCNRNNKVENAHDPIRDYIWDQMLLDGIRTFKEANKKLPHYIKQYNKVLKHKIGEENLLREIPSEQIDDAFLVQNVRSMDNKYTIQVNNKRYFIVRNNTILQKKARTKINVYTTYDQKIFVIYGGNKYKLVEATVDNLSKLKKIDGKIVSVLVKRNNYNFYYEGLNYHAIDSIGRPIKLMHRDQVKLSIIDNKIKKVRTKQGIFKVVSGTLKIEEDILNMKYRTMTYKQTIEFDCTEYILLDSSGERFITKNGSKIAVVTLNNKAMSAMHNGVTYTLADIKEKPGKYYIPRSHYDARKNFGDMI